MTRRRSLLRGLIKGKMPLLRSRPSAPAKSKLTMRQLLEDLPRSIGQRVFSGGTNAQLSMARTIQPPPAFSPRHGAKSLAISPRRSFLPLFPTKICAASAKRSPRSAITSSCPKSAVSALLRRTSWQRYCLPLLHYSPTPSRDRLVTRWSSRAPNRNLFSSQAHCISPEKPSQICAANLPPSKNARNRSASHRDALQNLGQVVGRSNAFIDLDPGEQRHRFANDMAVWQSPHSASLSENLSSFPLNSIFH